MTQEEKTELIELEEIIHQNYLIMEPIVTRMNNLDNLRIDEYTKEMEARICEQLNKKEFNLEAFGGLEDFEIEKLGQKEFDWWEYQYGKSQN